MSQLSIYCLSAPNWSFTVCSAKNRSGPFKYVSFSGCHSVQLCQQKALERRCSRKKASFLVLGFWLGSLLRHQHALHVPFLQPQGFPGSQLLWRGHWLLESTWLSQHQFLQWAASSVPGSGCTRSFVSSQLLKHRWLQALSSFSAWPDGRTPPSSSFPSTRWLHMKCLQRLHLLCNVPCTLENWFTPSSTDAVTALQSSGL